MLFIKIAILHLIALSTPGIELFFTANTSMQHHSLKPGIGAVTGLTAGCFIYCLLTLYGLQALTKQYSWLTLVVTVFGSVYLAWLGYKMLKLTKANSNVHFATNAKKLNNLGFFSFFVKGLLVSLSNPKAILYFASILGLVLTNVENSATAISLIALICLETFLWFFTITLIFSTKTIRQYYLKSNQVINLISGIIFIILAIFLLTSNLLKMI